MSWKRLFNRNKAKKQTDLLRVVSAKPVPKHIAIIMDGNGRWAAARQMPRTAGHRQGVEALREIIETAVNLKIAHLTLYAFSTENWKRPESEVRALMSLMVEFLQKEIDNLHKNEIRIKMLGQIEGLPHDAAQEIQKSMELTKDNTGLQVNIAINYGGRAEIVQAVREICEDVIQNKLSSDEINEDLFSQYLETGGIPDPDLMIRTGGEYRLSNFLLYQSAYTELLFTKKQILWPDFNSNRFLEAIIEYQNRVRRYGGIDV
jgi:undecaprenyl diphosphate synthase